MTYPINATPVIQRIRESVLEEPIDMLSDTPPEILTQIATHLTTAQSLAHLSLTCKRLNEFAEADGWRALVQSRFPSIKTPPYWKEAAHGLTTLSKAWDRKSFICRDMEPPGPTRHSGRTQRQTMGYQPVIDSYLDWIGNDWGSRHEVVAWGAGAELVVRLTETGSDAVKRYQESKFKNRVQGEPMEFFRNPHKFGVKWLCYRDKTMVDGADDITAVNLLRSSQKDQVDVEQVLVGRASGGLDLVGLSALHSAARLVRKTFKTGGRPVRSASVNSSTHPLAAACLSNTELVLYPVSAPGGDFEVSPVAIVSVIPSEGTGRTWTTRFLSQDRLAVGLGPSTDPLYIYDISPTGMTTNPLRTFGTTGADLKMHGDDRVETPGSSITNTSSVYAIAPIDASSQATGRDGEIFMSGWYDGVVRYAPCQ